jgi:hypothetical protein
MLLIGLLLLFLVLFLVLCTGWILHL